MFTLPSEVPPFEDKRAVFLPSPSPAQGRPIHLCADIHVVPPYISLETKPSFPGMFPLLPTPPPPPPPPPHPGQDASWGSASPFFFFPFSLEENLRHRILLHPIQAEIGGKDECNPNLDFPRSARELFFPSRVGLFPKRCAFHIASRRRTSGVACSSPRVEDFFFLMALSTHLPNPPSA